MATATSSAVAALKKAKRWLMMPGHWCKGAIARDAKGYEVADVSSPACVKRCAVGAARWQGEKAMARYYIEGHVHGAARALYGKSAADVNDENGLKAVLKVYDQAIEYAKKAAKS